jgi:hypothetical protein
MTNKRKGLSNESVDLIVKITNHYTDIMYIVKKICPRCFTKDERIIIFAKTEQMYNAIMLEKDNHRVKSKEKPNGKKDVENMYR